jgi:hypothetical protein
MAKTRYVSTFRAPSEYERQMEEARRRAMLAEALAQQQYEPMEGNAAPIPKAAPLVKALQSFMTARADRQAEEAKAAAEKAGRTEAVDYIRSFEPEQRNVNMAELAAMEAPMPMINTEPGGGPAVPYGQPGFRSTEYAQPSAIAAPNQRLMPVMGADGQPDFSQPMQMQVGGPLTIAQKRARALEGLESTNPMVQQFAMSQYEATAPKTTQLKLADINPSDFTPTSLAEATRTGDISKLDPIEKPTAGSPLSRLIAERNALPLGSPARAIYDDAIRKETTTAPGVSVTVGDKTANKYADAIAEGVAKQDLDAIAAGENAIAQIESSYRVRDLLKQNPITGTGAQARLGFEKALATAGFTKGDRASVTENLSAELAKTTLAAVRTSGLGSGQGFTDKDRQFLERAAAGQIDLTPANLNYLAELNEKAGRANIAISNRVRARARQLPQFRNLPGMFPDISAPAAYGSQLPAGATLD